MTFTSGKSFCCGATLKFLMKDLLMRLSPISLLFTCRRLPSRSRMSAMSNPFKNDLILNFYIFVFTLAAMEKNKLSTDCFCNLLKFTFAKVFSVNLHVYTGDGNQFKARFLFAFTHLPAFPIENFPRHIDTSLFF